jgi:hypothetical protein
MKQLLILIGLFCSVWASAQTPPGYVRINQRAHQYAEAADMMNLPAGTTAAFGAGQWRRSGAVFVDTTGDDAGVYYSIGTTWIKIFDETDAVGATLSNIGTGFDLAQFGTSNVKRLAAGINMFLDSSEVENTITLRAGRFGVGEEDYLNDSGLDREFDMNLGSFRLFNGQFFKAETISSDENIEAIFSINASDNSSPIDFSVSNSETGSRLFLGSNVIAGQEYIGFGIENNEGAFLGTEFGLERDTVRLRYGQITEPVAIRELGDRYRLLARDSITGAIADYTGSLSGSGMTNPMTTEGDMIYSSDGSGTPARLPIGTNGQVLTTVTGLPTWVTWVTPGLQDVITSNNQLTKSDTVDQQGFQLNWFGPNKWKDESITQITEVDYNSEISLHTYAPFGDTAITTTQDVIDGFKTVATDGTETHSLQVNGNGIFAEGLKFEDNDALRAVVIDTLTGEIRTAALGAVSGIDDVLAVGQSLSATRTINANSNVLSITNTTGFQASNTQGGYMNIQNSSFDLNIRNSGSTVYEQISANLSRIRQRHTESGYTNETLLDRAYKAITLDNYSSANLWMQPTQGDVQFRLDAADTLGVVIRSGVRGVNQYAVLYGVYDDDSSYVRAKGDAGLQFRGGNAGIYEFDNIPTYDGSGGEALVIDDDKLYKTTLAGADGTTVVISADVNSAASTSAQDITGLSFSVTSGVLYEFEAVILYTTTDNTIGASFGVNGPASPTLVSFTTLTPQTATSISQGSGGDYSLRGAANATPAGVATARVFGFVRPSSSGTFQIRFAPETATASGIVVKAGSRVKYWVRN